MSSLGIQAGVRIIEGLLKFAIDQTNPASMPTEDGIQNPGEQYYQTLQEIYDKRLAPKAQSAKESVPRVVAMPY